MNVHPFVLYSAYIVTLLHGGEFRDYFHNRIYNNIGCFGSDPEAHARAYILVCSIKLQLVNHIVLSIKGQIIPISALLLLNVLLVSNSTSSEPA